MLGNKLDTICRKVEKKFSKSNNNTYCKNKDDELSHQRVKESLFEIALFILGNQLNITKKEIIKKLSD